MISVYLSIIISFIGGYYMGQLLSSFVSLRPNRLLRFLVYFSLGTLSNTVIFNLDIVNITYAYIALCLVLLIGYRGPLLHKFSASVILYLFVPAFNYVLYYLWLPGFVPLSEYNVRMILPRLSLPFLIALLWYGIYRLFYQRIQTLRVYASTRIWILLDVISFGPLLLSGYIIVTTSAQMQPYSMLIIAVSILTEIGILYLVAYMAESMHLAIENKNLKIQQEYYHELEQNQLQIRKLRHDMNNHLGIIGEYLKENKLEEAESYFKQLSETVRGTGRVFCANSLVNAVINSKYQQAEALKIDTFFHIDLEEALSISDIELCSLFANTMDNALEACAKINEPSLRKIEMKARCKNHFFSYQIANSYQGTLVTKNGTYLSDKADSEEHGLGLSQVSDIVKKYHGTLDICTEDGMFTVTCIIPI
ncbi:MAG: GHKL domain-containing protein [Hespellia sp.]|nr:GHKL domain-containing protein [Hespellia sp.]